MLDKSEIMLEWLDEKVKECNDKQRLLIADERGDEAVFEKIAANVYDVFRTVLTVGRKTAADEVELRSFFLKRMADIPENWKTAYEKAAIHEDEEKKHIESIKIEASENVKNKFLEIWGES